MGFLTRAAVAIVANAVALWLSSYYIPGFHLAADPKTVFTLAAILTALNFVIKPIVRLVLGPIIILTLGLGLFIVNALMLYILDIIAKPLTIETVQALVLSTLLVTAVNVLIHMKQE